MGPTSRNRIRSRRCGLLRSYLGNVSKTVWILDPHTTRFDIVDFCQFYLAEYVAYNRPMPESFQGLELNDGRPLVLLARDPAGSKDIQVMRAIALKRVPSPALTTSLCSYTISFFVLFVRSFVVKSVFFLVAPLL